MPVHCSNLKHHFQICIFTTCNSLKWNFSLQLFIKRVKVVSSSGKHALLHLDPSFMSDREDEGSQTGSWIGRSPLWCSPELISLLKKLQGKVDSQSGPREQQATWRTKHVSCATYMYIPCSYLGFTHSDRDSDPLDNH